MDRRIAVKRRLRLHRLERVQLVPRPRSDVFAFFGDARNLEAITPDFLHFHIITPGPIAMARGTRIDYRLRLFGVPFGWTTLIDSFDPPQRFVDVQIRGPYRLWRHTHQFVATADGTLVTDTVEYALPFGLLGELAHAVFVHRSVERIFDHRRRRIAELLGTGARAREASP
jgi:ligand-binding SRPBCC domain-containing protein